jgi:hypothetical protein
MNQSLRSVKPVFCLIPEVVHSDFGGVVRCGSAANIVKSQHNR